MSPVETKEVVTDNLGTIAAIVLALIGAIKYAIEKGFFKFILDLIKLRQKQKPKVVDNNKLTKEQENKLLHHSVFNDYQLLLNFYSFDILNSSKKELPQLLFVTIFYYSISLHAADTLVCLEKCLKSKNRYTNIKELIGELQSSLLTSKQNIYTLLEEFEIPPIIVKKYTYWYTEHFDWYLEGIDLFLNDEDTLYEQLKAFLNLTRSFIGAIKISASKHVDDFNGDITKILETEDLTKMDFGPFSKVCNKIKNGSY